MVQVALGADNMPANVLTRKNRRIKVRDRSRSTDYTALSAKGRVNSDACKWMRFFPCKS